MNNQELDKLFRDTFSPDAFPYDENGWQAASRMLAAAEKRKRRRGILWWWGSASILLGGSVALWLFAPAKPSYSVLPKSTTAQETVLPPAREAASAIRPGHASAGACAIAQNGGLEAPKASTGAVVSTPPLKPVSGKIGAAMLPGAAAPIAPGVDVQIVKDLPLGEALKAQDVFFAGEIAVEAVDVKKQPFAQVLLPKRLAVQPVSFGEMDARLFVPSKPFPAPSAHQNGFSVTVYGGASNSTKFLGGGNPEFAHYISRRKSEERSTWAPEYGIQGQYRRGHFSVATGLHFGQWGERNAYRNAFHRDTTWQQLHTVQDTVLQRRYVFSLATGQPIDSFWVANIETDSIYTTEQMQVVSQLSDSTVLGRATQLRFVEVPVLAGYHFSWKKWDFVLRAGLGIGFLGKMEGHTLRHDGSGLDEVSAHRDVYRKVQVHGLLQMGVGYAIGPHWSLGFMATGRGQLLNTYRDVQGLHGRYGQWGITGFLGYRF